MTVSIAIVCEARADRNTACTLADRILIAHDSIHWIDEESIDHHREWRGLLKSDSMLKWTEVNRLAQENRVKPVNGHFKGLPGHPYAHQARRALLLLAKSSQRPQAVLFQIDADDQPKRRLGLEQAREGFDRIFPIIIGVAITERECWHLAGFDPRDDVETRILDEIRSEIGFHPCLRSQELTAKRDHHLKSAKRILGLVTQDNAEREASCLTHAFEILEERGKENGLADFLNEIRERLVPLFR